jgi:hypothetical protein
MSINYKHLPLEYPLPVHMEIKDMLLKNLHYETQQIGTFTIDEFGKQKH